MRRIIEHRYQILILLGIFFLFLLKGISAFDISFSRGVDVNFNLQILIAVLSGIARHPLHIESAVVLIMICTGIALSVLLPLSSPLAAAIISIVASLPAVYSGVFLISKPLLIPMEYSLLITLILFATNALMIYFLESRRRQSIINLFGQYVPPQVVAEICRQPGSVDMQGESRRLTVFFCDMKNFSNVAEQLNPRQLTRLLNEYFDAMTEILYRHRATIDKYIGDSIMAFWGAPVSQPDHAQRAVLASFDMHEEIAGLSAAFTRRGWPGPDISIGIHTGIMNVGNLGSKYRVAYTVIGDAVNLAARVEGLTRKYGVPTLVSEATMRECRDILFREIDLVQARGRFRQTRIFQPVCPAAKAKPDLLEQLRLHQQAVELYHAGDYSKACELFAALQEKNPDDRYYHYMLKHNQPPAGAGPARDGGVR